jgi:uncharacterized protein YceH (UPF0502 family)
MSGDLEQRVKRLESQVAWLVRQVKKILRVLGIGGDDTSE